MAVINDAYIDRFIDKFRDRLEALDSELRSIAEESQRRQRANLRAGETVPSYEPTNVCGEEWQQRAEDAQHAAYHDIERMFDDLAHDAASNTAEAASADAVATVTLALQIEPSEREFLDLWREYHGNATLRKAIRKAASAARVTLPTYPEDAVADNVEEARSFALTTVSNRWTRAGMAGLAVTPYADIDAKSVYMHLMGIDIFGHQHAF